MTALRSKSRVVQQQIFSQFNYDRFQRAQTQRAVKARLQKVAMTMELGLYRETQVGNKGRMRGEERGREARGDLEVEPAHSAEYWKHDQPQPATGEVLRTAQPDGGNGETE